MDGAAVIRVPDGLDIFVKRHSFVVVRESGSKVTNLLNTLERTRAAYIPLEL